MLYIYFNKNTRKLVCFSQERLPTSDFLVCKEVSLADLGIEGNEFNLARFRWEGDYETGKVVDLFAEKKSVVTQREIDEKYYNLFFRKYRLEDVIFQLILQSNKHDGILGPRPSNTIPFDEIQIFLKNILHKKQKEIEMYKSSPVHIYESEEDEQKRLQETFTT